MPLVLEAKRTDTWKLVALRPPYWRLRIKGGTREVVCGRKYCSVCGRWRHVCDFAIQDRRLTAKCRTCLRVTARYYNANLTPTQRELKLEYQRMWKDGRRREEDRPERIARKVGYRNGSAIDRREAIYFPVGPLKAALDALDDGEFGELARRAGVGERAIYRLRYINTKVQIDVADKLAVALGTTSQLLFGELWEG